MAIHIRRREFVVTVGSAAHAQQGQLRRVGVLIGLATDDPETKSRIAAFLQGMEKQGWSEGHNLYYRSTIAGLAQTQTANASGRTPVGMVKLRQTAIESALTKGLSGA